MRILRRNTWDRSVSTKQDREGKSRKRRLLERITRFASAPSLHRTPTPCGKRQSVSCVTLETTVRVGETPAASESTLDFFVECQETTTPETEEPVPQSAVSPWDRLPDELKLYTLSFLDPRELVRTSSVSQEWHKMCFDGQLWQTLDASEFYNRIPVAQLAQLIVTTGPFVKRLNLRGCSQLTTDWRIETVANVCRNLYAVNLEGSKFERNHVHFFILRNPTLVHLNIAGLQSVTNSTLKLIAQSCPNLDRLNVSFCTNADGAGLRRIIESCPKLRRLEAYQLHMSDMGFWKATHKTNQLEGLLLSHCTGIRDQHIQMLAEGPEPDYDPFTGQTTAPQRKLHLLDLTKCKELTDSALRYLAGTVPHLTTLILSTVPLITDAGLAALIPNLPRLKQIDLEECPLVTNATLKAMARGPAAKRLISVGISNCENLDDTGIIEVIRRCTGLRNLEMDNTHVSDLALVEAAHFVRKRATASTPLPLHLAADSVKRISLRLVIYDCPNITWTGVREIMQKNADADHSKSSLIQLKCFYEYQPTMDEHTKLVVRGDIEKARYLEEQWAEYMMTSEEYEAGGFAGRRAGRRARYLIAAWGDDGQPVRRRAARSSSCAIM